MNNNIQFDNTSNILFHIHGLLSQPDIKKAEELLVYPPKGTWIKKKFEGVIIGASFFSKYSLILLPFLLILIIPFIGFIGSIIVNKNIIDSFLEWFIFLIPSCIILWKVLLQLFGKVEIIISKKTYFFIGIFLFGKKKYIDFQCIKNIYEIKSEPDSFKNYKKELYLEGNKTIIIPIFYLSDLKSDYLILMIKYFMNKK